jgi:hypothetical protein
MIGNLVMSLLVYLKLQILMEFLCKTCETPFGQTQFTNKVLVCVKDKGMNLTTLNFALFIVVSI